MGDYEIVNHDDGTWSGYYTSPINFNNYPCPECEYPLTHRHCKIVCENCGYMEDCSDLG